MAVSVGIALAQLDRFVARHSQIRVAGYTIDVPKPQTHTALATPVAVVCVCIGIFTLILGFVRFHMAQYHIGEGLAVLENALLGAVAVGYTAIGALVIVLAVLAT